MIDFGENCVIDKCTDEYGEITVIILKGDKHVVLPLMTFIMFTRKFGEISAFSKDVCEQIFTEYEYHVGHGFYIRVSNTASCVDIRRFCRSSSGVIRPTHDAVSLSYTEFEALRVTVPNLELPNIEHCSDLHANQLSFLGCSQCNPFDYRNY